MKGQQLRVVTSYSELRAAAETEYFSAVDVQSYVRSSFEVQSMRGSVCTAEHEATLCADKLAAATDASAPAI
jgi:hypothetical protein